ncbi:MAG: sialate O-acetylesterase, partial [Cyanobacteria bacterium J06598_3]
SSNLTGQQGDWILEAQTGSIEADTALTQASQAAFAGTLNLLSNGGFENGLTGWVGFSGQEQAGGGAFDGSQTLQLTSSDAGTAQIITATAGATYTLEGYAKSSTSSYSAFGLTFFDTNYNTVGYTASDVISGNSWQRYDLEATAPGDAAFAQVWTYRSGNDGVVSIDSLALTTGSNPPAADTTRPTASVNAQALNSASGSPYEFSIDYSDNVAIDVSTLGNGDVRVTGPNGFNQSATFVSVNNNTDGAARTATYRINAPGGDWDNADNGTYTIAIQPNQVGDTNNNSLQASSTSFEVDIATTPPGGTGGTELLTNGGFESGLSGWFGFSGQEQISNNQAFDGSGSLQLSTADSGTGIILDATVGETYTLSGYAKTTSNNYSAFGLNFFDANYSVLSRVESGSITAQNWQQYDMEKTAPSGTAFVQVWTYKAGNNGSTFIDSLSLKTGDSEPPADPAPVITSNGGGDTAAVSVSEGDTLVTDVNASGSGLSFAIAGGTDANDFTINANTGVLSFNNTPDYEAPADANGDNVYAVDVSVTNSNGLTDTQALTISVTNEVSVFLLGGQSNMVGLARNANLPSNLASPYPAVQIWQADIQDFSNLRPGFSGASGNFGEFGPELTFGRGIDGFAPEEVYLIKHATGATDLANDWDPDGTNNTEYDIFTNRVTAALAELDSQNIGYDIEGMLWMQGESDTGNTASAYESNLTAFIADMRDRYGNDMRFVIGKLNPTFAGVVTDAQEAVAAADSRNYIVDTDSFELLPDQVHYNAAGQIDLGFGFADAIKNTF